MTSSDPPHSPPPPLYSREKPFCVALILCSDVIEDRRSGNKTLVGLFDGILVPSLPALHPRLFLMASLTSGTGSWEWAFRITGPHGQEVMRLGNTVRFDDPLLVSDLVVEVRNLPLEEAGVYFIDLLLGETPLANRRFSVRVGSPPPNPPPPSGSRFLPPTL